MRIKTALTISVIGALILVLFLWLSSDSGERSLDNSHYFEEKMDQSSSYKDDIDKIAIPEQVSDETANQKITNSPTKVAQSREQHPTLDKASNVNLTPEQIGNRPRKLSHILTTVPPFDGSYVYNYEVSEGFVPHLYRSAGFREGDILKAINGVDISDPENFKRADVSIANADTITFSVIRDGRPITLFLDIPSEELKISR